MFTTLLRKLARKPGSLIGRPAQTRSCSASLQIEALEDRAVPSALAMDASLQRYPIRMGEEIPTVAGIRIGEEIPTLARHCGGEEIPMVTGRLLGEEIPTVAGIRIGEEIPTFNGSLGVMGGKIGDGMNDGDDFTGSLGVMGGKIGDGMNDGDDYAGRGLLQEAINSLYTPRSGEEIPT